MKNLPSIRENPSGLHARYQVKKLTESEFFKGEYVPTDTEPEAEYFVLRLDESAGDKAHLRACRLAIRAYAEAIREHIPGLAKDLEERYPAL